MKNYLELVSFSAKVRRRQNRMSVVCIVLAVFLVTTIFGMADMYIRAQITQVQQDNGIFHVGVLDVSDDEAALIAARPDVSAVSRYGSFLTRRTRRTRFSANRSSSLAVTKR